MPLRMRSVKLDSDTVERIVRNAGKRPTLLRFCHERREKRATVGFQTVFPE